MINYANNDVIVAPDGKWLDFVLPPIPDPLPGHVLVRTSDGNPPYYVAGDTNYETATLVPGTTDVYDVYKSGTSFVRLLSYCNNVTEVLKANTTGITNMIGMFFHCDSLTAVPLFDTSDVTTMASMFSYCSALTTVPLFDTYNVTSMNSMCYECTSLKSVPLLNTSKVTDMNHAFNGCYAVETGALALYQQASSQAAPPSSHVFTFKDCGRDTVTGAAELAQIPSSWTTEI